MRSSIDAILSRFFHGYFRRKRAKQSIRESTAALVIQRAFRYYLFRKENPKYALNRAAYIIQRCWRRYVRRKKIIEKILSQYPIEQLPYHLRQKLPKREKEVEQAPRPTKRKILVELPPPWKNKNKNKLSPRDLELMAEQQEDDVKWTSKFVTPMFTKFLMKNLEKRDKLKQLDTEYGNRKVTKTFLTFVGRSTNVTRPVIAIFIHAPTFSVVSVHSDGISRVFINEDDIIENVKFPHEGKIIDAVIHRISGRVFCLLSTWKIVVFENGFFTKPMEIPILKPAVPGKCIFCDKFGHLWIYIAARSICYLLDPLCLTIITEIRTPREILPCQIFPLFEKSKLTNLIFSTKSGSSIYQCDASGSIQEKVFTGGKFTSHFRVNKEHVIVWNDDRKLALYKRNKGKLVLRNEFSLTAKPVSVVMLKKLNLLMVALSNTTISVFNLGNESYPVNITRGSVDRELTALHEDVVGPPRMTKSNSMYAKCATLRVGSQIRHMDVFQFSDDAAIVAVILETNVLATYWFSRNERFVMVRDFDRIDVAPMWGPTRMYVSLTCSTLYSMLMSQINRTRDQLRRDGEYIWRIDSELQKRFIAREFRSMDANNVTAVMMQCPYRRWCRCLNIKKGELTIYELSWLVRRILVSKKFTPEDLTGIIVDAGIAKKSKAGVTGEMNGMTLNTEQVTKVVDCLIAIPRNEMDHYITIRESAMATKGTISGMFMKHGIKKYDSFVIQKLTEIENIVKNRIRSDHMRNDPMKKLKKPHFAPKIPEIAKEPNPPIYDPRRISKSEYLLPNPLIERYRYIPMRELNVAYEDIVFCKYGEQYAAAKVVPVSCPISIEEVQITRPMSRVTLAVDVAAIADDSSHIVNEYPLEYVVLDYLLKTKSCMDGKPGSITIVRFWLAQILQIMASVHTQRAVLRTVVPSNFFVSYDGSSLVIQTLADAMFQHDRGKKPLPFENEDSPWLPPEFYTDRRPTSAFDVFQFGILMMYALTGFLPRPFSIILKAHREFSRRQITDFARCDTFYYDPFDGFPKEQFPWFFYTSAELKLALDIESPVSMWDVCRACLDIDPAKRPTAQALLETPFFNLSQSMNRKAQQLARYIIRRPSLNLFVDSIFGTLFDGIQKELELGKVEMPSLELAVNILGYFLAPDDATKQITFPVFDKTVHEVVNVIFEQQIFDRIVDLVINRLEQRIENEEDVENDKPFMDVVGLYHTFMKSYMDEVETFSRIFGSFKTFVTGLNRNRDSYKLLMFLHSKLRPLVEFFFTRLSPDQKKRIGVSDFYCQNFLSFYDNSRDFGEAFHEKSERRHLACMKFFVNFISNYPKEGTIQLMQDFQIVHKIEQCLCFELYSVRAAALDLTARVLELPFVPSDFFAAFPFFILPGVIEGDAIPYEEKTAALRVITGFIFSGQLQRVSAILSAGIIDSLVSCSVPKLDMYGYPTWGQTLETPFYKLCIELLTLLCEKAIPTVSGVIYHTRELVIDMRRLGICVTGRDFASLMKEVKQTNELSESIISTLEFMSKSSLNAIKAITGMTEEELELAMLDLCDCLLRFSMAKTEPIIALIFTIQAAQNFQLHTKMILQILSDFKSRRPGSIELVIDVLTIFKGIPAAYIELPKIWMSILQKQYADLRNCCNNTKLYFNGDDYVLERSQRVRLFRAMLMQPFPKFKEFFEMKCDYVSFILNDMLRDVNKFQRNLHYLPPAFVKFNGTFLIRNEGLSFIKELVRHRDHCIKTFYYFASAIRRTGVLAEEGKMLLRTDDREYRRGTVRLLNLLNKAGPALQLSQMLKRSELLMALRDEDVNDWENFQLLRNAWDEVSPAVRNAKQILEKPLYNAV